MLPLIADSSEEGDIIIIPGGANDKVKRALRMVYSKAVIRENVSIAAYMSAPPPNPENWRNKHDVCKGTVPTYGRRMPAEGITQLIASGVINFHIGTHQFGFHLLVRNNRVTIAVIRNRRQYQISSTTVDDIAHLTGKSGDALRGFFRWGFDNWKTIPSRDSLGNQVKDFFGQVRGEMGLGGCQ